MLQFKAGNTSITARVLVEMTEREEKLRKSE